MTALSVSTSMISWSAETLSPGWTLIATMVASAIDSPSCGMVIGTCGINLFGENLAHFGRDRFRVGPMLAPKIRVIRNRGVFGVDPRRCGIEEMESFGCDAGDHFRRHATPRERFADAKQSPGARDRREHRGGIERLHATQIDHLELDALGAELLRDGERFMDHRAIGHDAEIAARPNDPCFPDR